jgi:hypothetical protein
MHSCWKILLVLIVFKSGVWAQVQAARSSDFYNSVGVNTHWYYGNNFQYQPQFSALINLMKQAGIYHFRDGEFAQGYNTPSWITAMYTQLAANGMKAELIVAQGQTLSQLESGLGDYPGLEAIEPANEWDVNGGADWVSTLLSQLPQNQQAGADLGLAVLGPSLIDGTDAAQLGNLVGYMNFDNMHSYSGGRNPETPGWGADDSEGNSYGSLAWNLDMVHLYGPGLPAYATETGYQTTSTPTQNQVPETVAGTYVPRELLYYFMNGVPRTYLYELIDDPPGAQPGYGLLRYDLSPKPSFTAISNLLKVLQDDNTSFTPGSLDYTLTGDMDGVESLLLQKANGDFYLNVWLDGSIYDVNALQPTPQTPHTLTLTVPAGETVSYVASFNPDGTITETTPNQSTYTVNANSCVTTIRIAKIVLASPPAVVAASPTFSLAGGTYTGPQTVALADSTPSAQIYYTTDGSSPTLESHQYSGAITVNQTETVRAMAAASGYSQSPVDSAAYTINPPADYSAASPTFSLAGGTYTGPQTVALADSTPGAQIYYTTDGSSPTLESHPYSGAITVNQTETVRAMAVASGYSQSPVSSAAYAINPPADYSVAVNPQSLTVEPGQSGAASISINPQNGFNSKVTFTCSGLPMGASCKFAPAAVTPSGSAPANTTLTIVGSTGNATARNDASRHTLCAEMLGLIFCCLGLRRRKLLQLVCMALIAALGLTLVNGCAGFTVRPQSVVTQTVTVTATSGSLTHTANLSLTIE